MPDTPTNREFGYASREIKEIKHAIANIRTVIESNQERIQGLEMNYLRLKTRIATALAIFGAVFSLIVVVLKEII